MQSNLSSLGQKKVWPLKRGSMHTKYSMTGQEKRWSFNIGDWLIEVTALAGLTVLYKCCENCWDDP